MEVRRMMRMTLATAGCLVVISTASGTLTPRRERVNFPRDITLSQKLDRRAPAPAVKPAAESESEYVLTDGTEVLLDGKACKYEQIPEHADIVHLELAADKK